MEGLNIDLDPRAQLERDLFAPEVLIENATTEDHKTTLQNDDQESKEDSEKSKSSSEAEVSEVEGGKSESEPEEASSEEEEEKPRKKKAAASPRAPNAKVMEARKDFEEALSRISNSSNRRRSDPHQQQHSSYSESVEHDDYALALKNKMELALKRDIQSLGNGKPALERLRLLDQVLQTLNRRSLQEVLLENGILSVLRRWLEPLRTGTSCTLPSASFRKPILEALKTLPIETAHLRESGIGRIVYFFSKRDGELADIRKLAAELVDQWSRPIIAGSRLSMRDEEADVSGSSTPKLLASEGFQRHVTPSPSGINNNALSVYQKLTSGKRTNRRK